jgi:transposase
VCGANRHDVTQLESLLDTLQIPDRRPAQEIHLCLDKGYRGIPANELMCDRNFIPHVPVSEDERTVILNDPNHQPKRGVVEVAHSWFKRFRKLLVRFEKTSASFVALLHLAAAMICWRKIGIIYG